ncbi:MAG: carbon-nitrogen hydrolase family protein [Candidatus Synoicihabitans palmerolidicus]|nr:carbon-nitrogen hydrolase family protein [Candidatus Synoicihabitans palmerolidicus]
MPNYLQDPNSRNHASLIEWLNPDYNPEKSGARKVRVACVQYQMRELTSFAEFERQVGYFVDVAADSDADFVLFPELFAVQLLSMTKTKSPQEGMRQLAKYAPRVVKLLRTLAIKYGITVIGGSHPAKVGKELRNICTVCLPDGSIAEQHKLHITPNERKWWGITGGNACPVIETPTAKIGILICYDSEFPEQARHLADQGAEIIFVPFCTNDRQSYLRVRICSAARAVENQVYVALAGNVGNLPDVENMDVQYGQAAIFTPSDFMFARDGVAAEADSNEETVLICDLDLDDLHEARALGTVTPRLDRREDLFKVLATVAKPAAPEPDPVGPLGTQHQWVAEVNPEGG